MGFATDSLRESRRDGMADKRPAPQGGRRPLACHSFPTTFLRKILRKTHTFQNLVNKNNILCRIRVISNSYASSLKKRVLTSKFPCKFPSVDGNGITVLCYLPPQNRRDFV